MSNKTLHSSKIDYIDSDVHLHLRQTTEVQIDSHFDEIIHKISGAIAIPDSLDS